MKHIKNKVHFHFTKNWKIFTNWHDKRKLAGVVTTWAEQKQMIETLYNAEAPAVVNWNKVWIEVESWFQRIRDKKSQVLWNEQRRQIETVMLTQVDDLNSEDFVIAYLDKNNKPKVNPETMTYWDALRVQKQLQGDGNGRGGNEDMDRITIVNLNNLIQT